MEGTRLFPVRRRGSLAMDPEWLREVTEALGPDAIPVIQQRPSHDHVEFMYNSTGAL